MTIAVFGSINIDVTAYTERLPRPGETIHGDSYVLGLGGKGANQASAVAKLGAPLRLFGRVGRDAFGTMARAELGRYGVPLDDIREAEGKGTGIAIIGVDGAGQNCITVIAGANFAVGETEVARLKDVGGLKALLLQLEVPLDANVAAAKAARAMGALVILDPAPAPHGGLPDELIAAASVITPNEVECEALTGIRPGDPPSARAAAAKLRARGAGAAIVKMGAEGAFFSGPEGEGHVLRFPVTAIDTVAAGDCFNGALAVALTEGRSLAEATRFASAAAAISTTRRGAAAAAPTRAEVQALLG